jgi:hypothetical protein
VVTRSISGNLAPLEQGVRFEPCDSFIPGNDPGAGTCTGCGWLEEDHWLADLERRPVGV